jgi:hypothetical protein
MQGYSFRQVIDWSVIFENVFEEIRLHMVPQRKNAVTMQRRIFGSSSGNRKRKFTVAHAHFVCTVKRLGTDWKQVCTELGGDGRARAKRR